MATKEDKKLAIHNVMGAEEAAAAWGISMPHIKTLCTQGKIIARKAGRFWVIEKDQPNPRKNREYRPRKTEKEE